MVKTKLQTPAKAPAVEFCVYCRHDHAVEQVCNAMLLHALAEVSGELAKCYCGKCRPSYWEEAKRIFERRPR